MARQLRSSRDDLHALIDRLSDEEVEDLLDTLNNLADPDTLTDDERLAVQEGAEQIARGEYITREGLRSKYGL
jgi:hypothetical protein